MTRTECEQAMRQLWAYLDGATSDADRARIAQHLAACDACTQHFNFERSFLESLRRLREDTTADFTSLRDMVLGGLRAHGFKGGA
ncbi:MAG: putative zinc-finger [Gemmatimonadetes bacterium]|nr:putative zinc-finger [Gemmatimonadota bacterium]